MDSTIATIRDIVDVINTRSERTEILADLPYILRVLSEILASPVERRYYTADEYWCFWMDTTFQAHSFAISILDKIGVKHVINTLYIPVEPFDMGNTRDTDRDLYFIETDEDGRPIVPLNTSILDALDRLYKDPFNTEHSLDAFMELINSPSTSASTEEETPVPPAPKPSRQRRTTPSTVIGTTNTTTTNSSPPSTTRRGRRRT
jgi:hypothetical protein